MPEPEERATLIGGALVVLAWIATLAVAGWLDPTLLRNLLAQAAAHALLGRETGIPTGLATGTPWLLVAVAVMLQDAAILLVGYTLALAALRGAERLGAVRRFVQRAEGSLAGFAHRTERVGIAVLSVSLWVPFLPSGALTAALVGRAAGYRPKLLLPALLASLVLAAFANTALYAGLGALLGPNSRWWLAGGALAVTGTVVLVAWLRARRKA